MRACVFAESKAKYLKKRFELDEKKTFSTMTALVFVDLDLEAPRKLRDKKVETTPSIYHQTTSKRRPDKLSLHYLRNYRKTILTTKQLPKLILEPNLNVFLRSTTTVAMQM